jgi:uncharacterized membrane protein YphA (DoxX/SURF4 family)
MFTLSSEKCVCGAASAGGAPCGKCSGSLLGVGRILMALIFVVGGYGFVMNFGAQAEMLGGKPYIIPVFAMLPGMLMALIGVVLKVGGGLGLLLGYKTRLAANALIVYVVLATLMFHVGEGQLTAALKNIALIGGLLYIYVAGAGAWSLDNKKSTAPQA